MRPGQIVAVYEDPVTQTKLESKAELIGLLQDAGRDVEMWEVRFKNEIETYPRLIKKEAR